MCLVAGIRFYVGYRTDALMPTHVKELVGPRPTFYEPDYLWYGDGGKELYEAYKLMIQDICRRDHAASFLFYGRMVSAIIAHFRKGIIEERLGAGVSLAARYHKLGRVVHPYREGVEVITQQPTAKEVNKITGLVIGRDEQTLFSLFPPPNLWEEWWPGSGEWNKEEEDYFQDIVSRLERGARTALSEAKWTRQLKGRRHAILTKQPEREHNTLAMGDARRWVSLYDWAYGIEDDALSLQSMGPDFAPQRLPLFR
ncbi:hypothetical protein GGG16DRAFT_119358 [Schizophyllum commune]